MAALIPLPRWSIPVAALAAGALVAATPLDAWLARPIEDLLQRHTAPAAAPDGVAVVDIDDASLAALAPALGPWPLPRDAHALVLRTLREFGARAVVVQVLFVDERPGDAALARVAVAGGAPVVLAAAALDPLPAPAGAAPARHWGAWLLPSAQALSRGQASHRLGVVTVPLDADGVLRRLPLWHEVDGRRLPGVALAAWQATNGRLDGDWPVDREATVRPVLSTSTLPTLSYARVWRAAVGAPDPELATALRDRVVFVGSSALLADRVTTVVGQTGAADLAAQAYAALRDGRLLLPAPPAAVAAAWLLALAPALLGWRAATLPRVATAAAAAGAGLAAAAWGAVVAQGWLLAPIAPLAALVAGLVAATVLRLREQRERQRQLEIDNELARRASAAKSAFVANVSHEIRTPLNAVLGVAELLADTPLTPVQQRHLAVLRRGGDALRALIDDLLDLARAEAGRLELRRTPFAPREAVDAVAAMLRPRAEQKGLAFEVQIDPLIPAQVLGDRNRLEQALTNLVGNAVKFTPAGRVTIRVTPGSGEDAGRMRFDVEDTGIGIPPEQQAAVFDPFVQAGGDARGTGGSGLGLAITRASAELMDGTVRVVSEPGRGSRFTLVVTLPAVDVPAAGTAAAAAPDPAPASPPDAGAGPGAVVLLAEDNELNVYIATTMLHGVCREVDVAADGDEALARLKSRRYDLVFMDVQMPGLDGLAATRALRQHESEHGLAHTPVVALTAGSSPDDARDSLAAGCDAHLTKPVSRGDLLAAIARFAPGRSV